MKRGRSKAWLGSQTHPLDAHYEGVADGAVAQVGINVGAAVDSDRDRVGELVVRRVGLKEGRGDVGRHEVGDRGAGRADAKGSLGRGRDAGHVGALQVVDHVQVPVDHQVHAEDRTRPIVFRFHNQQPKIKTKKTLMKLILIK